MAFLKRKSPLQKEWESLLKKEQKFLKSRANKKESALDALLAEKVPAKLQDTLDAAFLRAFTLIFEKGTGVIEKTYRKEKLEQEHEVDRYAGELKQNRKSLRAHAKKAGKTGNCNVLLSGASGIGLGVLGIGLPDIPLFTAQLLRNIYQIALRYGYGYQTGRERYFILLLIQGGLSYGDSLLETNACIDAFIENPLHEISVAKQIEQAAETLSRELLYMKFLQGIPIVGAVGGACDLVYMKRVTEYAKLKFQRRYLNDMK